MMKNSEDKYESRNIELNEKEKKLLKKYKKKKLIVDIIFISLLIIRVIISIITKLSISSPYVFIITYTIIIIWLCIEQNYSVEIKRIESGYYKKCFDYTCYKCKEKIEIEFKDIEKYESLPKNKNGKRIVKCHKCNNSVALYNFDSVYKSYKKYLNKLESI